MVIVVEMIESINDYIKFDRSSYIYIITEIALIALIRHLITLDFHKIDAFEVMVSG
ncbi:MAG: phosphate-starvation-inducible PsiE family protein [Bacteroidales bacterium]|nr:phosphate-starvation-inducible PsiE family protein [Bacteroidales bacterium]